MGLDEFITESKTSSPKKSTGMTTGGMEQFIKESQNNELDVAGGYSIDKNTDGQYDTDIIKVFGGPGTGKTTTIVGNDGIEDFKGILHRMFEEYHPEDLMLIAYTRAAADEAKNRLAKLTDISKTKLGKRITTIHSFAMGKNNLRPKDIVEIAYTPHKYNYCKKVGLPYKKNANNDQEDIMAAPTDDGHLFFDMNSWLKSSLKPASEAPDCPLWSEWEHGVDAFVDYYERWEAYKKEQGVMEFDDAILECVNNKDVVDAKYVFVDEVQDLYPLQQAFLDNHIGNVERIFLAGDDDQTIYEWAGARPQYFLDMDGVVHDEMPELWKDKTGYWDSEGVYILDQSWRMPSDILKLSKMCIEQVNERQEKTIKPHHEGGEFIPLRNPTLNTILTYANPDDTYVLFRAKYQINNFGKKLIDAGIPYEDMRFKNTNYGGTWNKDTIKFRDGLAAIKNGNENMTGEQASRIIEEMPDHVLNGDRDVLMKKFGARTAVPTETVASQVKYGMPENNYQFNKWLMEFEELNWYQENAVKNNLRENNEHMYPDGFRLSTIHGSKGREADTVILSCDSTQSIMENMPKSGMNDAERRLYYVGMTRTKNRLVMVEGMDADSPTFPIDTILGSEWREEHDWENMK